MSFIGGWKHNTEWNEIQQVDEIRFEDVFDTF